MIRFTTVLVTVGTLFTLSTQAQITVNFNAAPGERNVVDSSANPVPDGNLAEIGYFTPTFDVSANKDNFTALQSEWHLFGAATITHLPIPTAEPGRFAGVATQNDAAFDGQKIYLFITETNNSAVVTQYGLFTSSSATWIFPPHGIDPPGNQITVTSDDVNSFLFGSAVSGTPGSLELGNVVVVPEPTSIALLGLGLAASGFWFRRKR